MNDEGPALTMSGGLGRVEVVGSGAAGAWHTRAVRRLRLMVLWLLSSMAVFAFVVTTRMASDELLVKWKMGDGDWLQTASLALFSPTVIVFFPVPLVRDERAGLAVATMCVGAWGAAALLGARAVWRRGRAG